jgi:hypothetical protein
MPRTLLAAGTEAGSPPGWVLVLLVVLGLVVLRWLYRIGFFGNVLRALATSVAMLVGASVVVYAAAVATNQTAALEGLITRHTDAVLGGVCFALVVGTIIHYPRTSAPTTEAATSPLAAPAAKVAATGQTDQDCCSCNGTGERRCDYQQKATQWWGAEYVREWCDAGDLRNQYGTDGRCRVCCGRGFVKCSTCRARGTYRASCERCGGKGTV